MALTLTIEYFIFIYFLTKEVINVDSFKIVEYKTTNEKV